MNPPTSPIRLLHVCTANICRSAFAEVLTRHLLDPGQIEVTSAGTHGFIDQPMDPPMLVELESRGADGTLFRSRRLTPALVENADLVLTMEVAHRTYLLDDAPWWVRKVYTLGQFAQSLADVDPTLRGGELLTQLAQNRRTAVASDDVADPFGRGASEAARAASHIETELAQILPRLI